MFINKQLKNISIDLVTIDVETQTKRTTSQNLVFKPTDGTNLKKELFVSLQFSPLLFSEAFINPILYKHPLIPKYIEFCKKKHFTRQIPRIAIQVFLAILKFVQDDENYMPLFLNFSKVLRKRDKISYAKLTFCAFQFLKTTKCVSTWYVCNQQVQTPMSDLEGFLNIIDFKKMDQQIALK